jgi:hypothetical protein
VLPNQTVPVTINLTYDEAKDLADAVSQPDKITSIMAGGSCDEYCSDERIALQIKVARAIDAAFIPMMPAILEGERQRE